MPQKNGRRKKYKLRKAVREIGRGDLRKTLSTETNEKTQHEVLACNFHHDFSLSASDIYI